MKQWFRITICAFFAVFCLVFFTKQSNLPDSYIGKDVSLILSAISNKDREKLSYFFKYSILWDTFGYVLLGEKPMALGDVITKINPFACLWEKGSYKMQAIDDCAPLFGQRFLRYLRGAFSSDRIKLKNAYKTWKKYEKFFPLSQFLITYENSYYEGCHDVSILLINKKAFIEKVNQHLDDFKMILNRDVNGETLLEELKSKPFLSEVLMNHDGLIGILFGYGRENAFWYHQRYHLQSDEQKREFYQKFQLKCKLSDELGSLWTEEDSELFIENVEIQLNSKDLEWIPLPVCRADLTSSETQELRLKYLKTRQALLDYYKGKDFLEATLRLLTSQIKEK